MDLPTSFTTAPPQLSPARRGGRSVFGYGRESFAALEAMARVLVWVARPALAHPHLAHAHLALTASEQQASRRVKRRGGCRACGVVVAVSVEGGGSILIWSLSICL